MIRHLRSIAVVAGIASLIASALVGCQDEQATTEAQTQAQSVDAAASTEPTSLGDEQHGSSNDPSSADSESVSKNGSEAAVDSPPETPVGPSLRAGLPTDRHGHKYTNRLINETSPYLLQHAHNPVDWYPWGEEAFERAKAEDKPVFLSVGYSTCYWCHVMERESFEDEQVGAILNEHVIAIKLDREERPDVDEQYVLATQLSIGRGGWPNSVWMTPDGRPFSAGTYFPRQRFIQTLHQMNAAWQRQRDQIEQQADELAARISEIGSGAFAETLRAIQPRLLDLVTQQLKRTYDRQHGGFGRRPKFPPHGRLRLLAALYEDTNEPELLELITGTLDAMAMGGMHDHVGGGFHRYATDEHWFLPHFEKMLYDNAQLMRAYTDGYRLGDAEDKRRYRDVIDRIYFFIQREMTDHERGILYSAIDAEVDTVEGQNIVWFTEEVVEVLGEHRGRLFADVYGFENRGNYVEESSRHRPGNNIPYLRRPVEQIAEERGLDPDVFRAEIEQMRDELLEVRDERKQPLLDDKTLTSWNALMIEALAYAGRHLKESRYVGAAVSAADGVLTLLGPEATGDDHLLRVYRDGRARNPGFLDDYAYMTLALLELHAATEDARWLEHAQGLAGIMLEEFEDRENGAFFFSADHHDQLITRSKGLAGGGNVPSGNGIAVRALYRLAEVTGEQRYAVIADRTLESLSGVIWRSIHGNEDLLRAVVTNYLADNGSGRQARRAARARGSDPNQLDITADVSLDGFPVSFEAYTSRRQARPGETFFVAVALDIDDGWHLYGPNRGIEVVQPTELTVAANRGLQARSIAPPEPTRRMDEFFERELETFSGKVWYLVPVRVNPDAETGEYTLTVEVLTQACDHRRCLPPRTETITIDIEITSEPADEQIRHVTLFRALRSR